jgi:hypothetical protein
MHVFFSVTGTYLTRNIEFFSNLKLKPVLRIRIHMFLGLMDPHPLDRGLDPDLDPSVIKQK